MSTTLNVGELLNLVGLSTGVVLYAMLLAMVVRAGRTPAARSPFDPLLLVTSLSSASSGICARCPRTSCRRSASQGPFPYLAAVGFARSGLSAGGRRALGPARRARRGARTAEALARRRRVRRQRRRGRAARARRRHRSGRCPRSPGMRLLTYTFVALVVPLAAVTRGQPGARRALWAAALAMFAVSALHLSQLHQGDASWPVELLGHHASLPLAFAILYQDYPFALADLFLKRALTLLAIVDRRLRRHRDVRRTIDGVRAVRAGRSDAGQRPGDAVGRDGAALSRPAAGRPRGSSIPSCCHRPDYRSLRATIAPQCAGPRRRAALLDSDVCDSLAPALSARVGDMARVDVRRRRRRARRDGRRADADGRRSCGSSPSASARRLAQSTALVVTVPDQRGAAVRPRDRPTDGRPAAAVRRPRDAGSDRRASSRGASTRFASRTSGTSARSASRRSASSPPRRSCARSARRSIRTFCSTR